MDVKALNKFEAIALKKALQKTDSVVFGSGASRILSGKKTAKPKDIDLAWKRLGGNYTILFLMWNQWID